MPGSRLTYEDRRRIAAGLAEDLDYAEIARQLSRPTSTISREVSRNGGAHEYRPDRAHEATGHRAQRVRPVRPAPDAVHDFEQRFAETMVATGLPRMPARVLTCLLISEHSSLPAAELVRRLGVSPASVSKAVAYLEQLRLIRRERDPRLRRERYVIDEDVWYLALDRVVQVCAAWADAARQGVGILGDSSAGARMSEMSRYFEHVGQDLANAADRWRHVLTEPI